MNSDTTKNKSNGTATNDNDETIDLLFQQAEDAAHNLARAFGIDNPHDVKTKHPGRAILIVAKAGGRHFTLRYGYPAEIADALCYAFHEDTALAKAIKDF